MSEFAIVVIGYNRLESIERLLKSLLRVDYAGNEIDLIISIDNSGTHDVIDYANHFVWHYGKKKVYTYPKRMGLKKHILHCGDFVYAYEAIAVLEDDLFVAPGFYHYLKASVDFYNEDSRIAGISLYNHLWNVNERRNFQAAPSQFDTYFLQFAQSWGQIWTRKQWKAFMDWYPLNQDKELDKENYPDFIIRWPESSWLKYHIMYCVENAKYFVYPYIALTTCFSDKGEHTRVKYNILQIPFAEDVKKDYHFASLNQDAVCYDVFFERQGLGKALEIEENELCVNLYGTKKVINEKYHLTMQSIPRKVVCSYALELRPQEMNIINQIPGNDIFLYDMKSSAQKPINKMNVDIKQFAYYQKIHSEWRLLLRTFAAQFRDAIISKIRRRR